MNQWVAFYLGAATVTMGGNVFREVVDKRKPYALRFVLGPSLLCGIVWPLLAIAAVHDIVVAVATPEAKP